MPARGRREQRSGAGDGGDGALDAMRPGPDGRRVCSRLRAAGSDAGILIATA
ncbi:hypothetical protein GCM10010495_64820 [Kitasatospora herbaricolor]|uniref:hypothetical protein n=1 Tax=Kitasatospora herbaricolor TaxID=68217 RepID=UPI00174A82EE|nr:hypothetical protein [Kitasatospora herbaricolor]GGV38554.1 hypothetical protein GCM10010495_64820 [Kitasatospora herbaricolor]